MPVMPDEKFSAGFSLIELMITLVIMSVLLTLAIPAYRDHMIRAALPQATSGLSLLAMRMEEYYQDHRSYASGEKCGAVLPATEKFSFNCTISAKGQAYLLTATGAEGDITNFSYTLDQSSNASTVSVPVGWGNVPVDCWVVKRGGAC